MDTLTIGIFLLVFLAAATVLFFVQNAQGKEKRKRLMTVMGVEGAEASKKENPLKEKRKDDLSKKLKELSEEEGSKKKSAPLSLQLQQAGMEISTRTFFIRSVFAGIVFTLLVMLSDVPAFVVWVSPIIGTFGLPKMFLKFKIKKRQKAFINELADALEAMIRLLKAGMPITECISMVSREFEGPVGEEMALIYEAQKIGVSLPDAVSEAAKRVPIPEMKMFATGISIQVQTGASLSEVLQNLANVIRGRFRLKRKVASLSSEAKASATIIGALPFLVAGALYAVNPTYMELLWTTEQGKTLMYGAGFWMSIGVFVMKQIVNIKV